SRFIAFFADHRLKRISAAGGPAAVLADALDGRGGSWSREGVILFSPREYQGLSRVPADGGTFEPATRLDPSEESHRWPWFLPDGKRFVFLGDASRAEEHYLRVGALGSQETTRLFRAITNVAYVPGYLLFVRDRSLLAQPVDARTLRPSGEPSILGEGIVAAAENHMFSFSISETGLLVFRSADIDSQLAWLDRGGRTIEVLEEAGRYQDLTVSPSGRFVSFGRVAADGRVADYWSRDLARGVTSRLTFHSGADFTPIWSPDESELIFASARTRDGEIFERAVANAASERKIGALGTDCTPTSWSRDGRSVLLTSGGAGNKSDILKLDLASGSKPEPLIATPFEEYDAVFSPDGKWIAYASEESGRAEIFVQSYPSLARRVQVTAAGGSRPSWRADGHEIFFNTLDDHLAAVEVREASSGLEPGAAVDLFARRGNGCAPAPDGKRFLCDVRKDDPWLSPMTVVVDWPALVAAAAGAPR
ncbi:MAG TPA: hypothetical protein VE404_06905, partial [Verrucomicrobiae bacterium]|nr:hypothetical protein [Verrucomicrobiae bacterium]